MSQHSPRFAMNPSRLLHGADYNPDQWPDRPDILEDDLRLMKLAHCNVMSVGIFAWTAYEPEEGRFTFAWMDRVMDKLAENGIRAILATPSGAKPAWMSQTYPEIRRVLPGGMREPHRGRHNHCLTSPVYRGKVRIINTQLAERYRDHPALAMWHLSNEYGGECHCPLCYAAFREWLRSRYDSLDALNAAWWTGFWSHRFTDWGQIEPVDASIHGLILDWKRFVTDQTADFLRHERATLLALTPGVPVTTNMMGTYPGLNYWKLAAELDVASFDAYPNWHGQMEDWRTGAHFGFLYDLNRSLKGGRPFLLMESTPSTTNWMDVCRLKQPGMHRLSSLQAVAHGADTVQYFQWRKGRGGSEKFHGAVVDHAGHENTRVFRDVADLGRCLEALSPVAGASVPADVALVFDWENWWAFDQAQGHRNMDKRFVDRVVRHYVPFWKQGIPVDIVSEDSDWSRHRLLVAPLLHMVRPGVGERIEAFVQGGGTFVTTFLSGVVNESDLCFLGGFPGPLRRTLGIWVEETDALYPEQKRAVLAGGANPLGLCGCYEAGDYMDHVHPEGAGVIATYDAGFLGGAPAVTMNRFGQGEAYYIASWNDERFQTDFFGGLARHMNLRRVLEEGDLPEGVTAQRRSDGRRDFVFLMNFNPSEQQVCLGVKDVFTDMLDGMAPVAGIVKLPPFGLRVLARPATGRSR